MGVTMTDTDRWQSPCGRVTLYCGDCLAVLATLPDNSVDSVATDPPAGIGFMGKDWDHHKGGRDEWVAWLRSVMAEALRVLKPGGHALVWSLPRTSHWTATAAEDAGFELRDRIAHCFGSGFPKSLDVSKAIDKAAGAEREIVGSKLGRPGMAKDGSNQRNGFDAAYGGIAAGPMSSAITAPATPAARQWQGWGTALKPAIEDWWLARKPLSENTVAANVLRWGTGAINVDGCRVDYNGEKPSGWFDETERKNVGFKLTNGSSSKITSKPGTCRFPSHLIHDGSDEVVGLFPVTKTNAGQYHKNGTAGCFGVAREEGTIVSPGDSGSAARFFYCAKASREDREDGNHHPTVKPSALMRYLCRLITPPGGVVLDCFMGSGSTGKGAVEEGFRFIGIEQDADYVEIAKRRIEAELAQGRLWE
jgi:site-specific DNA-methyltransferase (adenine-specific)